MIDATTDNIKDPLATTIIQAPHTSKRERIRRVLLAVIAAAAFVTALYQALDAARELLAERDTVKAIAETTRARLDAEREKVAELEARLADAGPERVAELEEALAAAQEAVEGYRAELDGARQQLGQAQLALAEKDAEIARLATTPLPPPPAAQVLAPPLPVTADYGDPHVNTSLEQYLSDLLVTLADDGNAARLARDHPLRVLYDVDRDLIVQGTVGDAARYRLTEWHAFNDYRDLILESVIVIDAPADANAAARTQQALTAARGAGELDDQGRLTWTVGAKTVTLDPGGDVRRAVIRVIDSYQAPEVMQIYNRR